MIRIGVIEDDSNMRKIVSQIIEKEIQGYEEVKQKTFESAEEFLQERAGYDIVISDIESVSYTHLVAYARAAYRLSQKGESGARSVFDIAPALLSQKTPEQLRAQIL